MTRAKIYLIIQAVLCVLLVVLLSVSAVTLSPRPYPAIAGRIVEISSRSGKWTLSHS